MIKTTTSLHWLSRALIFALALMLVIGAGFATPTRAQNETETTWYWATTPEGLVAYNPTGEINLLLAGSDLQTLLLAGFRTSSQTALLWDHATFYQVSESAVLQTYPMISMFFNFQFVTYRHPYMTLSNGEPEGPGYVLNIETSEIKQLSGGDLLWYPPVILADGHTLRYVSTDPVPYPEHDGVFSLRELDLETGQEKVLLADDADDGPIPDVVHSPDGEQWWMASDYDRDNGVFRRIQTFGVTDQQYTDWFQQNHAFVSDDQIWHFNIPCVDDCRVDVFSFDDIPPFSIQLPTMLVTPNSYLQFYVHAIYRFADDSVILNAYIDGIASDVVSRFWLPSMNGSDGEWLELGWLRLQEGTNTVWDSQNFSEDGRWALALNKTDDGKVSARLWRLSHREIAFEIPLAEHQSVTWRHSGETVFIYVMDAWAKRVQTVILRGMGNGPYYLDATWNFFEILADGSILYERLPGSQSTQGIYRLEGNNFNQHTLLVPDGKPLYLQIGAK